MTGVDIVSDLEAIQKMEQLLETDPFEYDVVEQALRAGSAATEKWRGLNPGEAALALRNRVDLTQRQLAALSGLPRSKIALIEAGQDVRLSTMRKYFMGCGCELLLLPRGPASALAMKNRMINLEREGVIERRRRYPR
ncbi:MAG: hypothetical protein COB53_12785 [Elusimicrobia bacterium]|nr:MAG: hypothetical protein COB53_12785 [Elusimicrobiota bacterium]